MISQVFSEAGDGLRPDHGTNPISAPLIIPAARKPIVWQAYDLCPEFPELAGLLSQILAEIARRCPAFGHGRTFSPYQTGRDQTGGRAVPAALISDPASLAAASAPQTATFPWRIHHRGKPICATKRRKGKGRHMNSSLGLRRPMFLAGGCAYWAGISSAVVQKSVISDCLHRPLLQSNEPD